MTSAVTFMLVLCGCVALSLAQYNQFDVDFSGGYFGTSFRAPSYGALSAAASRDPRADTGPVVFPPSPPGDSSQTSGVVPGASGYGFRPPGSQGLAVPRYFFRGYFIR